MFSSKEADKKIGSEGGIPKVIQPGNVVARIIDLKLEVPPYDSNAYNLAITLETSPIEDGFIGLPINKENPDMGNYQGQVARVQSQQYSYSDYTNSAGKTTTKEDAIFRWVWNFAKAIGISETLKANDVSGSTIEEFIENVKPYIVNGDRYIHWCIGGSEYENKSGYTQYRLFVVRSQNNKHGYATKDNVSTLITFDENTHIRRKKAADPVESFSGRDASSDLDLE